MFGDELHGHSETCVSSPSFVDLSKGTFPNMLQHDVVIHRPKVYTTLPHIRYIQREGRRLQRL